MADSPSKNGTSEPMFFMTSSSSPVKPRVKTSMFNVVNDCDENKSLQFGDNSRRKRHVPPPAEKTSPESTASTTNTNSTPTPSPVKEEVNEEIAQMEVSTVQAQPVLRMSDGVSTTKFEKYF